MRKVAWFSMPLNLYWRQDSKGFPTCWILIGQFKFPSRQPHARWLLLLQFLVFLTFFKKIKKINSNMANQRRRLLRNNEVISTFYDVYSHCSSFQGKCFWKSYNRFAKFHFITLMVFELKGGRLQILLSFPQIQKTEEIPEYVVLGSPLSLWESQQT